MSLSPQDFIGLLGTARGSAGVFGTAEYINGSVLVFRDHLKGGFAPVGCDNWPLMLDDENELVKTVPRHGLQSEIFPPPRHSEFWIAAEASRAIYKEVKRIREEQDKRIQESSK